MKVIQVPVLSDNYSYLLVCTQTGETAIVDPADATPLLREINLRQLTPIAILNTHHHLDHCAGNNDLAERFNIKIFSGQHDANRIENALPLNDNDFLQIGESQVSVLEVPGHTQGHIAFYGEGILISGDTLFVGGCGRVFEGTPEDMYKSLQKITRLPNTTKLYCGHEYTEKNLEFAMTLEPNNPHVKDKLLEVKNLRQKKLSTVPSLILDELAYNPFLRTASPEILQSLLEKDFTNLEIPDKVFAAIRELKNKF